MISKISSLNINSFNRINNKAITPKASSNVSFGARENSLCYPESFSKTLSSIYCYRMPELRENIQPIQSKEEYLSIIRDINSYYITENGRNKKYINMYGYHSVPRELMGLIPYCGVDDISDDINSWLSGRKTFKHSQISGGKMLKIVQALDYSLKKLDEKFGKYRGTVYRVGFFNPTTDTQFYSSTTDKKCLMFLSDKFPPSSSNQYSIIKLKNGHKIRSFQRKTNSLESREFERKEQEILIDRHSKFELVHPENYTRSELNDVFDIVSTTMNSYAARSSLFSICDRMINMGYIQVWREI